MIKFIVNATILTICGALCWFLLDSKQATINFLVAAFSSSIVIFTTYIGYARVIKSKQASNEEVNNEDEDEKITTKSALSQTYKGILFPLRIVAYCVLVFGFLALNNNNFLSIFPFLSGLAIMPIVTLLQMYFIKIKHESN